MLKTGSLLLTIVLLFFMETAVISAGKTAGRCPLHRCGELRLDIAIYDKSNAVRLHEVRAGDSVVVRIMPQTINGTSFISTVNPVDVALQSGFQLLVHADAAFKLDFPNGITGPTDWLVVFTKVPDGAVETIEASGASTDISSGRITSLSGRTSIRVLPGAPAQVLFINPGSNTKGLHPPTLIPGKAYPCTLMVFDKFGNRGNIPVSVLVRSCTPTIAVITTGKPDTIVTTDSTGIGAFSVRLTDNAIENDVVRLEAMIADQETAGSFEKNAAFIAVKRHVALPAPSVRSSPHDQFVTYVDLRGRRVSPRKCRTHNRLPCAADFLRNKKSGRSPQIYLIVNY